MAVGVLIERLVMWRGAIGDRLDVWRGVVRDRLCQLIVSFDAGMPHISPGHPAPLVRFAYLSATGTNNDVTLAQNCTGAAARRAPGALS